MCIILTAWNVSTFLHVFWTAWPAVLAQWLWPSAAENEIMGLISGHCGSILIEIEHKNTCVLMFMCTLNAFWLNLAHQCSTGKFCFGRAGLSGAIFRFQSDLAKSSASTYFIFYYIDGCIASMLKATFIVAFMFYYINCGTFSALEGHGCLILVFCYMECSNLAALKGIHHNFGNDILIKLIKLT